MVQAKACKTNIKCIDRRHFQWRWTTP